VPSILIADDNSAIRTLLHTFVETQTSFRVCGEACDGQDAIEKAKKLQPDVVLIDLAMPRLNGIEASSILKRTMPGIRVILFSFHVEQLSRPLASIVGIDFVLSKGEPLSKLADYLRSLPRTTSVAEHASKITA
jgi:two-component system vancomycin resistance associated response regulator VraR